MYQADECPGSWQLVALHDGTGACEKCGKTLRPYRQRIYIADANTKSMMITPAHLPEGARRRRGGRVRFPTDTRVRELVSEMRKAAKRSSLASMADLINRINKRT